MSDHERDALAEVLRNHRPPLGLGAELPDDEFDCCADALLESEWLAEHDSRVAAKALWDASADAWQWTAMSPGSIAWLRERAIEAQNAASATKRATGRPNSDTGGTDAPGDGSGA